QGPGTYTITVRVTDDGTPARDDSETIQVTVSDVVTTGAIGDVDGDQDFDANDSFLIHLVKLSGTNQQIDQSKGSSEWTAEQIRSVVDSLLLADVDDDRDFDANDTFLIHLVMLSGTDQQIDLSKGDSSLGPGQIRTNVEILGLQHSESPVSAAQSAGADTGQSRSSRSGGVQNYEQPDLFQYAAGDSRRWTAAEDAVTTSPEAMFTGPQFREWIDML
ncbi:MAG: cadherin repeat domain-containing protein, partial [Fuerstiella sp.]